MLSPSPSSAASRRIAFPASRSSSRSAQMRSTRDDTVSDMVRYSSISWMPAANESRVGARLWVSRESLADIADGVIGGKLSSDDDAA